MEKIKTNHKYSCIRRIESGGRGQFAILNRVLRVGLIKKVESRLEERGNEPCIYL